MKSALASALLLGSLAAAPQALAHSEEMLDCPFRDAPFSTQSPLLDLLISPPAKAIAEETLGPGMDRLPPIFLKTQVPSFASIITLESAAEWAGLEPESLAEAQRRLAALEVTDTDRMARCARYDEDMPQWDLSGDGPRVLLFEKINGYRDTPSVEAARAAFRAMAEREGWQLFETELGGAISPEVLGKFDLIVWNNISGDVLTLTQRQALRDFVEGGGGFVAMHGSAGDPVYFWDWFPDTLIGARFQGHPRNPQFQDARVVVDDPSHPTAAALPTEWTMRDEWYSFRTNPRDSGSRIILTLDETTYDPDAGLPQSQRMGQDHPIAWSRIVGKGRVFYSAIGHLPETYSDPRYEAMLTSAVSWAGRFEDCDCD